jgi:hypothetical protein
MNKKAHPDSGATLDVERQRIENDLRRSGAGGSPLIINRLKAQLIGLGVQPVVIDSLDPIVIEADLRLQVMRKRKLIISENLLGDAPAREINARGNKVAIFVNLDEHTDALKPRSEPDGE